MTEQEINENRQAFIDLCHTHIQRPGLDELLDYLGEKTDFFTAPSSTRFHLNEAGGLCKHSINVFNTLCTVYHSVVEPAIKAGNATFAEEIPTESMAVAALLHDVCKANYYHLTTRWRKDAEDRWESYPGYEIRDSFPFGHGEKSCIIISWFMRLKQDELLAIRWHMGMFEMGDVGSSMRHSYREAMERSPLVSLLHTADMIASNCLEVTTRP